MSITANTVSSQYNHRVFVSDTKEVDKDMEPYLDWIKNRTALEKYLEIVGPYSDEAMVREVREVYKLIFN